MDINNNKIKMNKIMSFTVKKVVIVVGVVVILFLILGLSGCREEENKDFTFERWRDFYIVRGGVPDSEGHLAIPARHRGIDVIWIGHHAFKGNDDIKSAFIPNTIERIQPAAFKDTINMRSIEFESNSRLRNISGDNPNLEVGVFENSGLESIVLPRSLELIGIRAFFRTSNLIKVDFEQGSKLELISESAFAGSALEWIRFPASLRRIGLLAFDGSNLKEIDQEIDSNLEVIESVAFRNVTTLLNFTIPISLIVVAALAFYGWESHQTIYVQERSEVHGIPGGNNNARIVWNAPIHV